MPHCCMNCWKEIFVGCEICLQVHTHVHDGTLDKVYPHSEVCHCIASKRALNREQFEVQR